MQAPQRIQVRPRSELPGFHPTVHAVREGICLFTGICSVATDNASSLLFRFDLEHTSSDGIYEKGGSSRAGNDAAGTLFGRYHRQNGGFPVVVDPRYG